VLAGTKQHVVGIDFFFAGFLSLLVFGVGGGSGVRLAFGLGAEPGDVAAAPLEVGDGLVGEDDETGLVSRLGASGNVVVSDFSRLVTIRCLFLNWLADDGATVSLSRFLVEYDAGSKVRLFERRVVTV
jgi:hypothetical protein